jgi:hypothetical protein
MHERLFNLLLTLACICNAIFLISRYTLLHCYLRLFNCWHFQRIEAS